MTVTPKQKAKQIQQVRTSVLLGSDLLDGTTTTQTIELGDVCSKITFQSDGDLAGTIEFSVNGKTWGTPVALAAAMTSFSTHNVAVVRLVRSSGSGRVTIAGK